jgi:hypothetical protein
MTGVDISVSPYWRDKKVIGGDSQSSGKRSRSRGREAGRRIVGEKRKEERRMTKRRCTENPPKTERAYER